MMKKSFPFNSSCLDDEDVSLRALPFRCELLKNQTFPGYMINFFYFSATSQTFLSRHIFHIFRS